MASGAAVLLVGTGALVYTRLNANLRTSALFGGTTGNAGQEKVDAFGRSPIDLLVIGSDSRASAADCKLGGDCAPGANADVEMVLHIAADRSNATVMSVPRDTVTELPPCRDPQTGASTPGGAGQINSTLAYGPGCTVAAVHQLTGIPIDHFAMIDFAGVISMSDTVGGVPVCVSADVYDPYSHLALTQGTHTLIGRAALEFVRSRHAFGDGSDLGRTYAQHLFLSAVIRRMESARTLVDPLTLYALADAATKALSVDTDLGSLPRLVGLAADLAKVPANRITFTTMQTTADPTDPNRVVPAPSARRLFDTIVNDQSLSSATGATTSTSRPTPTTSSPTTSSPTGSVRIGRVAVTVLNGSGTAHRGSEVAAALIAAGYSPATSFATAPLPASSTSLHYGPGRQAEAAALAATLRLPPTALAPGTSGGLVLTIGADWPTGTAFGKAGALTVAEQRAALDQAHARTAGQSAGCADVSTQATVVLNGVPMTPTRAFALRGDVPLSAP